MIAYAEVHAQNSGCFRVEATPAQWMAQRNTQANVIILTVYQKVSVYLGIIEIVLLCVHSFCTRMCLCTVASGQVKGIIPQNGEVFRDQLLTLHVGRHQWTSRGVTEQRQQWSLGDEVAESSRTEEVTKAAERP
jgi:hypothetical protein